MSFSSTSGSIAGLNDVVLNSPATNQILVYDGTSAKWQNQALAPSSVTSVNSRTGAVVLAKSDVALANVDNTSDATKNSVTATLTNKTISGATNTLSNIPESAVTNLTTDLAAKANTNSLATVATSGSYTDLTNKPTIPTISDATTSTKGIVQLAGDLAGTAASPSVAKLNGIAVSGTPVGGQVLTATSATAATWQAVTGGGSTTTTIAKHSLTGGRLLAATGLGNAGSLQYPPNWSACLRAVHTATTAMSDVRLVYRSSTAIEADAPNAMNIKVGLEYPTGTITPVTFNGRQTYLLDPNGVIISDAVPVDIPAGATFWTRTYQSAAAGNYTTVTTAVGAGVTSFQVAALPNVTSGTFYVGSGGTREAVTVTSITGTGNPYTVTLSAVTVYAHGVGDSFGQGFVTNRIAYGDLGEGGINSDYSYSGTITTPSAMSTTLTSAVTAGATTIQVPVTAFLTPTMTIGSETITIKNVVGTANPFTAYLSAPLANSYASGTTVTAAYGVTIGFAPTAIVSDSVNGAAAAPIVVIGDSICQGVGYNLRQVTSFVTLAFNNLRPLLNTAVAGEAAFQYVSYASSRRRRQLLSAANWVFYEYGVNDIYSGQSLAQVQANVTTILTLAKNRGLKCAVTTLTPRTSSTDNWATTGNQTIAASGFNTVRVNYNAWVRAGAGGLADLVVELADVAETARDSGIWKVDATNGAYTADGIHPSYVGHQILAAAIPVASFT